MDRRMQFIALAVVILILLPAISMTDDLLAAQNPAEIDCSARRAHDHGSSPHSIVPAAAALPVPSFAGLSFAYVRVAAPGNLPSPLSRTILPWPRFRTVPLRPPDRSLAAVLHRQFLIFRVRRADHGAKVLYEADLPFPFRRGNGRDPCAGAEAMLSAQQALTWDQVKARFEARQSRVEGRRRQRGRDAGRRDHGLSAAQSAVRHDRGWDADRSPQRRLGAACKGHLSCPASATCTSATTNASCGWRARRKARGSPNRSTRT